ncbi:MAG: Holliday junction resolvase RuvX [Casimicrobiaceae bacterium]|nr:Holliday junction resolvase RuvX [Casimicrobiaceae bacterium]MCX8099064.1 Holliday junction resolvase RuvX [Casimicrobiaceae bacterium]MDW8312571.1 Holliday junction resolvase RuvX [Burkholderiales bacterium]
MSTNRSTRVAAAQTRPAAVPGERTVLAFDFGERRTGIAVGQELGATARPLAVIVSRSDRERLERLSPFVAEWEPDCFVVGRPTHPDGAAHALTARAERFSRQLRARFGRPVFLVDERYSSIGSSSDAEAAAEILRRFHEMHGQR